jgi:hypothetical protein
MLATSYGFLVIIAIACTVFPRPARESLTRAAWPTPHTCPSGMPHSADAAEKHAVACAEAFIRRNGYTEARPISDSTQLAAESYELPVRSLAELLEMRRGSLVSRAYGVCRLSGWHAYTVVFRLPLRDTLDVRSEVARQTTGRAITMDSTYQHVTMQHRDFSIAAIDQPHQGCHRLSTR